MPTVLIVGAVGHGTEHLRQLIESIEHANLGITCIVAERDELDVSAHKEPCMFRYTRYESMDWPVRKPAYLKPHHKFTCKSPWQRKKKR